MEVISPQLRDFILFCARQRGSEWPTIYDEMAKVAGQRLFHGLGYHELKQLGLSFSLSNLDQTMKLVKQATSSNNEPPTSHDAQTKRRVIEAQEPMLKIRF